MNPRKVSQMIPRALYLVKAGGALRYVLAPTLQAAAEHVGGVEDIQLVSDAVEVAEIGSIGATAFARSCAAGMGYSLEQLQEQCRLRARSRAREAVAQALSEQYGLTPGDIADILMRDRSTVCHMLRNVSQRRRTKTQIEMPL